MLRRLSIIVLAGWAAFASNSAAANSAVSDPTNKVTSKGSVTYEAGAALPSDSQAIVDLRHLPALPNAPAVVNQKIDLADKQSPIPFEFAVERYRLVGGVSYVVRSVILSGTRVILDSDDVTIAVAESAVDVKEIALIAQADVRASSARHFIFIDAIRGQNGKGVWPDIWDLSALPRA